ncbi:MAG: bifunctional riboflavin kinase/FAD synthetase [Gammaproteobacteria bacterium]|nr:MAG: bifunctional riboflavin kinase/FAD synthetase [Gammaproteobacteria bacterium]
MELVRGLHNLRPEHRGCAATIGSFDGIHLGHQAVLTQLAAEGRERRLPVTLITFEPQPREYFMPQEAPPRLTRFREKLEVLQHCGVDRVVCLRFNAWLASLTADEFIQRIMLDGLAVKYLVVGDDFRFGKGRIGDYALLQQAGETHGFPVVTMPTFNVGNHRVSSTRIRVALNEGDFSSAEALLGRPYWMSGRVAHGDKRGRTIGFPTANIFMHRNAVPVNGVFAVEMCGIDDRPIAGVANVGTRPTVDGSRALLEVHLFDFDRDIYGRHVQVSFLKKLRPERKFESFELLKRQIERDAEQARAFFAGTVA